jgi:drug/metabolite transporter (DMT)-like permease
MTVIRRHLPLAYPLLAILLWAGNVIVSRLSAHVIGPQAITFYRLLLAVAVMSPFIAAPAWRNRSVIWPRLGQFFILGFLAMCLFQSLSYLAAQTSTAANMALFTALTPMLTLGLSVWLLGETPTWGLLIGGMLAFAGLAYLVSGGQPVVIVRQGLHAGDALMFAAALVYAMYGVLLKRWRLPVSGWQSTYMQAVCALVIMFPALLATPPQLRALSPQTFPLILYAGVMASVVLPFFWVRGVERLGPSRCAMFMYLLPIFTAMGAIGILGEPVRAFDIIGGVIVLAGVALAQALKAHERSTLNSKENWWLEAGSNRRPVGYESTALTI